MQKFSNARLALMTAEVYRNMKMQISKKGASIMELSSGILGFVVVAVVAVVGFLINAKLALQTTSGTYAYNATVTVDSSMQTIVSFLPIVAIVLVGGFVIVYLLRSFGPGGGSA